jgi:hypothetical protein
MRILWIIAGVLVAIFASWVLALCAIGKRDQKRSGEQSRKQQRWP